MRTPIASQKNQQRKQYRQVRQALEETFRAHASQVICDEIEHWPLFQHTNVILSYMPIKTEVDLRPLFSSQPQKCWVLPRIVSQDDRSMSFHIYDPHQLTTHPFGMAEPKPALPTIAPSDIQLALIPGLAFDLDGCRLGYGGGYFDRFLQNFLGISVGITFEVLRIPRLPRENHDISMHWLATENGLFAAGNKNIISQ